MKKEEAKILSPTKSNILIEYIRQILSDDTKVTARINIRPAKIENESMCTYDIYVPERNYEEHLNTGIDAQQSNVLFEQILLDLIDNFTDFETTAVTKWQSIKSNNPRINFDGISIFNVNGSQVKLDFGISANNIKVAVDEYNAIIKDCIEKEKNKGNSK